MNNNSLKCPKCNGVGEIYCIQCRGKGFTYFLGIPMACSVCQGKGHYECPACEGTGHKL